MLGHALNELGHKIGAKQQYSAVGCMSEATTTLTRAGVDSSGLPAGRNGKC